MPAMAPPDRPLLRWRPPVLSALWCTYTRPVGLRPSWLALKALLRMPVRSCEGGPAAGTGRGEAKCSARRDMQRGRQKQAIAPPLWGACETPAGNRHCPFNRHACAPNTHTAPTNRIFNPAKHAKPAAGPLTHQARAGLQMRGTPRWHRTSQPAAAAGQPRHTASAPACGQRAGRRPRGKGLPAVQPSITPSYQAGRQEQERRPRLSLPTFQLPDN